MKAPLQLGKINPEQQRMISSVERIMADTGASYTDAYLKWKRSQSSQAVNSAETISTVNIQTVERADVIYAVQQAPQPKNSI